MDKLISKAGAVYAVAVTLFSAFMGEYRYLFAAFLALNIADYITGVLKARLTHTENSNKGLKGAVKKVGYWIVVAVAFFIARFFCTLGTATGINLDFAELFGWFTLATFIINEIRSLFENLVVLGVDVPDFLTDGLEVAAKAVESKQNHGGEE